MSESEVRGKPRRRLFTVLAAVAAFALVAVGLVRLVTAASDRDPRSPGTLEDLLALRERTEFYDKWADPREQRNVVGEQSEVTEALKERAVDYLNSPPPPWGEDTPRVEIDELQLQQLRALGYGVD
jgi:hypothetical protein